VNGLINRIATELGRRFARSQRQSDQSTVDSKQVVNKYVRICIVSVTK